LVGGDYGLVFSALASSVAAVATLAGARLGLLRHRFPRVLLGVAVAAIAFSYWIELFDLSDQVADMRRGAGWLMWPALAWTAWSGIRYSRRYVAEVEAVRRERENNDGGH
jgi:phosphatidylglycerophosphate synthase